MQPSPFSAVILRFSPPVFSCGGSVRASDRLRYRALEKLGASVVVMAEATPGLRILLHQHVKEKTPVHVSSHDDRDRIIEIFRNAMQQPGKPASFALRTVQEAVNPVKQTVLVLEENQALENALRKLLQELVSSAINSGEMVMTFGRLLDDTDTNTGQIPRLLDVMLYLCEKGHIEGGMIFQLLEDLIEMSTMKDCKEIFGYIDTKRDILGKPELYGRGKLVMLRTCNQLLRRLSKANDVVFCGRIIMFLAHFFLLSERSAVNIKGTFNTSKETKYEQDAPDGVSIDFNFYKTFWSLQEHFSHRASATTPVKWQKFTSILGVVLETFEAQPLNDEDGNSNNFEDESSYFSTKYLTSSKLMGLELKDPSFRRHILVQCLIFFDYLKAPGKSEKDVPSESMVFSAVLPVLYLPQLLVQAMMEEIRSCEERVKKLLEVIPPKGKQFLKSIEHILEREKNWVWWKRDGCPAFDKPLVQRKTNEDRVTRRKPRWRLGNKELSQLWKRADQNPDALTDPQRARAPSITEYWKPLADDMDESAGIEAEYHHKNNRVYCWKGLRFSARQDLEGFSRFTDLGIEGVVPPELLPSEVRSKLHAKPNEKSKRAKREEGSKSAIKQSDNQVAVVGTGIDGGTGLEKTAAPMDTNAVDATIFNGGELTPDEGQKQSSGLNMGQEGGQSEAEVEVGDEAEGEITEEFDQEPDANLSKTDDIDIKE